MPFCCKNFCNSADMKVRPLSDTAVLEVQILKKSHDISLLLFPLYYSCNMYFGPFSISVDQYQKILAFKWSRKVSICTRSKRNVAGSQKCLIFGGLFLFALHSAQFLVICSISVSIPSMMRVFLKVNPQKILQI